MKGGLACLGGFGLAPCAELAVELLLRWSEGRGRLVALCGLAWDFAGLRLLRLRGRRAGFVGVWEQDIGCVDIAGRDGLAAFVGERDFFVGMRFPSALVKDSAVRTMRPARVRASRSVSKGLAILARRSAAKSAFGECGEELAGERERSSSSCRMYMSWRRSSGVAGGRSARRRWRGSRRRRCRRDGGRRRYRRSGG